ncbi:TPR-like protein [Glarea lozoyensis ATCC 20868]|uniref:TPR-like protein n=1 Tax=Glarea lozoyensis (strain ATCC 20868 / MF5171) TaxID=1116229 RepID=S3DEB7_GLAL2|nr:TPR-like protein [Glarea lozoyensis ATCC 20868]EPE36105.1 TPR-like protein [Glarea lozoyensis ATCC 20868]
MRRSNRKRKAASVALENNDTPTSSTDGAQSQENLIRDHPGKSSQLLQSTESLPSNPKSPLGVRRSSRRNKTLDSTALGKETNEECELQGKDAHEGIAKPQKRSNAAVSKTKKRQSIRKNSSTALASPKISSNPIDEPFESLTSTSVTAGAELTSSSRNDESSHGPQMEGSRNPGEDIQQLSEAVHNSPLRQKELQDVEPRGQVTGERSAHTPSPVFSKEAEDITSVRVAEPEGAEATSEALEPRENGTLEAISKAQSPKPLDVEEARESQNQFSRSSGLPVAQFAEAGSVGQAAIGNVHGTGIADDPMVGPNNLMARSNAQNKPVSRVPEHFISSHGSSSIPDPEQLALPQQPYIKPHASSPQPMSSYDNARPRKSLPPLAPKTPSVSEDASQGPEQNRGLQSEPHHLSQFHTPFFGRLDGQYFQASLESETRSIYGDQFRTPSSSYPVPVTIPYATPYGNKQPKKSQSTSESSAARPMSVSMYGTFIAQDPPSVRADQPMPATPVESQLHTPNTLQPLLQHDPSTTFSYQSHQQTTSTGTSDRGAEGRGRGRGRGKARRRGRGRGLFSGVMEGNLSDDMIAQLSSQLVGLDPDQTDDFSTKLGKRTRASSRGRPRGRPRGRAAGRMGDVQNTRDLLPSPSPMIDPRLLSPEKTNQPQINGNWAYQYPTGIGNLNGSAQNCSANQSDYHVGAERSFSSKMPLEYSQVPRGGPINRYPKLAPAPPSNYPLGLNDLPKESSPLSDEDFVVRRPNETLDSFQSRAAFESAAAQARARHRALYEDSESNSEEESGEEHEQRSDSDSASEDEAIQTNDGYISDADSDYLDYKQSMSKLSKDVNKLRGLNDEEQNTAGSGRGGIKRRRGRGKGSNPHRGPRKPKELTGPIKLRLGKATQLFIGQQHDEAMALVDEVIGINSETYEAWTLKASLFQERGNIESAIESLWVAAHLRHKHVDPWFNCAALCLEGTGASRALYLPRAQRCFANAARCQPTNLQAYLGKADVYFEREMFPMAVNTYEHILKKVRPHSLEVMRRVGESAIAAFHAGIANGETAVTAGRAEIEVAINRYTKEIAHFKSNPDDFDEEIGWSEVLAYSELFIFDGRYERAIKELSSLARWLVGREEESFWEDFTENDAEWDISNSRRSGVPSFKPDAFTPESYGLGLPLELRAKLGIYRLRLGHEDEAMASFTYNAI